MNDSLQPSPPSKRALMHFASAMRTARQVCGVMLLCGAGLCAVAAQDKIVINDRWPIRGPDGPVLSPPHVEPTNECSKQVYVDSFIPHATIKVFIGGATLIGGPAATEFGFTVVGLTQQLHVGDSITATQTVNGVTSAPSAPMIVGQMPSSLPAPSIDPKIYECGQVVPVHNLTPGVNVEVIDSNTNVTIGTGETPNLWGSDWDPVITQSLKNGHQIEAFQSACTGVKSPKSAAVPVQPEPSPVNAPTLDAPIIGNDAITAHGLYIGSALEAKQTGIIGAGLSTAETNWMHVAPPITATPDVTAEQKLCHHSPPSPPQKPTNNIPKPTLLGPICPGQIAAFVRDTTINAILVLLKNNAVVGYGGAAPGDVPVDIAPPSVFAEGDTVQIVEYINANVVFSKTVKVGCTDVVTYHNDDQRTGWNPDEITLTSGNVRPLTFGLITSVALDDQVDAQPLVVTNQPIKGQGTHSVVYVATEGNTVYAIDSWTGAVLMSVNLGPPVPITTCTNNGPNVGINSTPTIDRRAQTMYVMAYTLVRGKATYELHALDLSTLADKAGSPMIVSATHVLTDGSAEGFEAEYQRQRVALLLSQNNVYAAFASFCDHHPSHTRGWLLGWKSGSLIRLPDTELVNQRSNSSLGCPPAGSGEKYFLSSIWMSGYGLAAEHDGDIFFVTGNSDCGQNTYSQTSNLQESVVKMKSDLSGVLSWFTPSNVFALDQGDVDYGSGGVMVIPDQPGPKPKLAVAAGKDGRMFIMDRSGLGGFNTPDVPKSVSIGGCWCGPSYYNGADGAGRVVSSGGFSAKTWKINTAATPALSLEATSSVQTPSDKQGDGGFFTSISSNRQTPASQIIWAIGRPTGSDNHVTLYAFNGTASGSSLPLLWSGTAGTWPSLDANADLVPTVANGRVYVASYKQLTIFGLHSRTKLFPPRLQPLLLKPPLPEKRKIYGSEVWGVIKTAKGERLEIALRNGKLLNVDIGPALKEETSTQIIVGRVVHVFGSVNAKGILEAHVIVRAKARGSWGEDTIERK